MQQHHGLLWQSAQACRERHERAAVFHEDDAHPSVEIGLQVADASKPGDELGVVPMLVEPVLGPTLDPMQQHPPQWYALSHYGVAAHPTANRLPTGCQDLP